MLRLAQTKTATNVLSLISVILLVNSHSQTAQAEVLGQPQGLTITTNRELYGMSTDFDAPLGGSVFYYAFSLECDAGGSFIEVTVTHSNPQFSIPSTTTIQCGSIYALNATFTPSAAGLTSDNVTFSSSAGTVTKDLIGNGVPVETPEQWVADLSPGTSAQRLLFDDQRNYLYITDSGNNRVIVFSPESQSEIASMAVGVAPVGLALTPDNQQLYVANSGESSVSVVDLNSQQEAYKISLPSLGPFPGYTPYDIAVVSDTLALIGSAPPGLASGSSI